MKGFASFCLLLSVSTLTYAKDFYIDPVHGTPNGNGSKAAPWPSLNWVLEKKLVEFYSWDKLPFKEGKSQLKKANSGVVKGGDTLFLMPGNYGAFDVSNFYLKMPLTIRSMTKNLAKFHQIKVTGGSNLVFDGIMIEPDGLLKKPKRLFSAIAHNWQGPVNNISLMNSSLSSFQRLPQFTKEQWQNGVVDGIYSDASHSVYRNNKLINTGFSITIGADHIEVSKNLISYFSGDGIRALGDYGLYDGNIIKNSIDLKNGNHDDGIQSWSRNGKPVTGVILRNNLIINYEDPAQPLKGPLQGIGLFDGFYDDWVIENNVVIVNQWHGITLTGFRNCKLVNNTVLDLEMSGPKPWIMLRDHKNGQKSEKCLVRNNLATGFKNLNNRGVIADHNFVDPAPNWMFKDFFALDLRLKPNAPVVDAGIAKDAPNRDILGNLRGPKDFYDIGAYEYQETP